MSKINIRKRGDKWEYRFETALIDGKRHQLSKCGFRTKKEALEAGSEALAKYSQAGTVFKTKSISVSDYLNFWFENDVKASRKYNTVLIYHTYINKHIIPYIGSFRLSSLTPNILLEWLNKLATEDISRSTIKQIRSTMSLALGYAVFPLRYISVNPLLGVKLPKCTKKPKPKHVLTNEEYQKILELYPFGTRPHMPFVLAWNLGLRISEVCGLTWDDIDLEACTCSVSKQIVEKHSHDLGYACTYCLETPKTATSKRIILFGETLRNALIKEKQRQETLEQTYAEYYSIIIGEDSESSESINLREVRAGELPKRYKRFRMVCTKEDGGLIVASKIKHYIDVIQKRLSIPISFHCFRHTHATRLLEAGASLKAVQQRLGHAQLQTSYNIYMHCTDTMQETAVNLLETLNKTITDSGHKTE